MNKMRVRMTGRSLVSCSGAVMVLALIAGCDSRPAADPAPKSSPPPVQGELIQPKSVTNAVVAAVPTVLSTPTNSASATSSVSVPSTPATNSLASISEPPKVVNGFLGVGFDRLSSFTFEVTDEILQSGSTNAAQVASRTAEQIPKTVMSYDQKRIALKGFMLPLKVEGGKVTEMLIMRDQSMCCYGAVPKINEWVSVKMVGEGVRPIMDQAITLYGKLYVGEMRENGYLVGIYRMDGERIDGPAEN